MADQFENDKFSVLIISSRGNIEYCNQQFLQMSKYNLNELLGENINIFINEKYKSDHNAIL